MVRILYVVQANIHYDWQRTPSTSTDGMSQSEFRKMPVTILLFLPMECPRQSSSAPSLLSSALSGAVSARISYRPTIQSYGSLQRNSTSYSGFYCAQKRYSFGLWDNGPRLERLPRNFDVRGAKKITRIPFQCSTDRGWTRRHGLFLLMGGFVLCNKDGQPSKTLSFPHFSRLVRHNVIEFPRLTSLEIQERSNLHPTFTFIALMQATWFVAQCLSRFISASTPGPVITQLEAITAIIVISNWCIFFFAWKKPLDIQYPILIKPTIRGSTPRDRGLPPGQSIQVDEAFEIEQNLSGSQIMERRFQLESPPSQSPSLFKSITTFRLTPRSFVAAIVWPFKTIYRDIFRFIPPDRNDAFEFPDGTLKIPTFYVQNTVFQPVSLLPAAVLGMGVSIVSLIFILRSSASTFQFLSQNSQLAWRIAAITSASFSALILVFIILINVLFCLTCLFGFQKLFMDFVEGCLLVCVGILFFSLVVGFAPFLLARFVLVVVSVISLGSGRVEVLVGRSWTDYIPHFS